MGTLEMSLAAQRLSALQKPLLVVLSLGLLLLIGFLDYLTGRDFHISAFYLAPIVWVAWSAGKKMGILLAIAGAATWFIADSMADFNYRHPLIPYWNALMLCVFFLIVVHLLTRFQAAHAALEKTVRERTAALQALESEIESRKRLEAAKLQAERLALAGKMAAQVAHEIRNPLGSLTLNLDLIRKEIAWLAERRGHSPEEGIALVKEMREEVGRIGRVIADYLQFARPRKLQRQPLALNAFLDQKLAFLGIELERTNIILRTDFDPALTTIHAAADQLWQALLNLIRNSCEAMPNGGQLTVRTLRQGSQAILRVMDDGEGMTEEQCRRVFEPFFTTKTEGIGLGMAVVHQVVTEHGGHIECESTKGKGAAFTIFLPLAKRILK